MDIGEQTQIPKIFVVREKEKTMPKYADITPFYEWLEDLMRLDTSSHPDHNTLMFYEIFDELDSLPELVRCKDCKHSKLPSALTQKYGLPGTLVCNNPNSPCNHRHTLGDGYCPYGVRKDG